MGRNPVLDRKNLMSHIWQVPVSTKEMQIQDRKGKWYEMRVRPYLTAEKKIDGVVLSFLDIDILVRGKVCVEKSQN